MPQYQYRDVKLKPDLFTGRFIGEVVNREGQRGWELVTIRQGPEGETAIFRRAFDEGLTGEEVFEASAYDGMQAAARAISEENQLRMDEDRAARLVEAEHTKRAEVLLSTMPEDDVRRVEAEARASLPSLLRDRPLVVRAMMRHSVLPSESEALAKS